MSGAAAERSRRSLLSGLVGGAIAFAASSLGRPQTVAASTAVGNGDDNPAVAHRTLLHNTHANVATSNLDEEVDALFGWAENNGAGVAGQSTGGPGVKGYSGPIPMPNTLGNRVGVYGAAPDTVGTGVEGHGLSGVIGFGNDAGGTGVIGNGYYGVQGSGQFVGVNANSQDGDGLQAGSSTGFAIHAYGRVKLEGISGIATIAANAKSVTVVPSRPLTATSFVLLTPTANLGRRSLWYSVNVSTNRITINISSVYSTTKSLKVAWLQLS